MIVSACDPFEKLPSDIYHVIFQFLSIQDVVYCMSQVSRLWLTICSNSAYLKSDCSGSLRIQITRSGSNSATAVVSQDALFYRDGISDELLNCISRLFPQETHLDINHEMIRVPERPEVLSCPELKNHEFYTPPSEFQFLFDLDRQGEQEFEWKGLLSIAHGMRQLQKLCIRSASVTNSMIAALSQLNPDTLQELHFDSRFIEQDRHSVVTFPHLIKATVPSGRSIFFNAPNLKSLTIGGCPCTNLEAFPMLEELVSYDASSDIQITTLRKLRFMRGCNLMSINRIVETNPHLEVLQIINDNLNYQSLGKVLFDGCSSTHLKHLKVSCQNTTRFVLRAIADAFPNLSSLFLSCCTDLEDSDIIYLVGKCKNLTHLELPFCNVVTDISLTHIAHHCGKLRTLHIFAKHITPYGIPKLHLLEELKNLILMGNSDSVAHAALELRQKGVNVHCRMTNNKREIPKKKQFVCTHCQTLFTGQEFREHLKTHEEVTRDFVGTEKNSIKCILPECTWIKPGIPYSTKDQSHKDILIKHLHQCKYNIIKCPGCQEFMPYSELSTHIEVCPTKKVKVMVGDF